jgi:hypothetical protein
VNLIGLHPPLYQLKKMTCTRIFPKDSRPKKNLLRKLFMPFQNNYIDSLTVVDLCIEPHVAPHLK